MKIRSAFAAGVLVAAGMAAVAAASAPAQAAVVAPSKACYPICTPTLSATRTVVAPGYRLTFKMTNFRPKSDMSLSIPGVAPDTGVTSATGAITLHLLSPTTPGKYRVTATAAGQSVSIWIYVPRITPPAFCKAMVNCRFDIDYIEPGTTVKFMSSGVDANTCYANGESPYCLVRYKALTGRTQTKQQYYRVVTGFIGSSGKVTLMRQS